MATWEVMYSVYSNNINDGRSSWERASGMRSHFTTSVNAPNQTVAESMVKAMNGGPDHVMIRHCIHRSN